jgi:hypothetical protein
MLRKWMLGGLCSLLLASVCSAQPGIVKTRDGQTFEGEITETADQVIIERKGIKVTVEKSDIRSISYSNSVEQEYQRRLAKLTAYDVRGRLDLAQWVFQNKAYALALEVLNEAQRIQPRNEDVAEMIRTVERQIYLERREERKRTPIQLATADNDPRNATTAPTSRPAVTRATRLVTPDEMNLIRQNEWHGLDQPIRVTFKNDVRRSFLAAQRDVNPADFNRVTPAQQAWVILQNGTPDMKKNVVLLNDPPVLIAFTTVQRALLGGCAACHTADKSKGNFVLRWPSNTDAERLTNFLILQQYTTKVGDRTYSMIDRDRPQDSLLLQFALPPVEQRGANVQPGTIGHPNAGNYRGVVRSLPDPKTARAFEWISALNTPAPDYSMIDLSGAGGSPANTAPPRVSPAAPPHTARPSTTTPARGR